MQKVAADADLMQKVVAGADLMQSRRYCTTFNQCLSLIFSIDIFCTKKDFYPAAAEKELI